MNGNNSIEKQRKLKKKRLTVLLISIGVILLLVLLNMIDFESTPATEDSAGPYVPETYPLHVFLDPDYESDIFYDPDYIKLDHSIEYSFDNQTVSLKNDLQSERYESYDPSFDKFFVSYFTALTKGFAGSSDKTEGFNAFFSEVYFRNHPTFSRFAPQKVYDIEIRRRTSELEITSEEKEEDAIYVGCTLTSFEVRYKIFGNDGTFRRDIVGDEVLPQYIDLLCDKQGNLTINSVSYARPIDTAPAKDPLLPFIMPLVWLVLMLISLVILFIVKNSLLASPAIAAFATFLVSMQGSLLVQLAVFVPLAALLFFLFFLRRKKARSKLPPASEDDTPENQTE